MNKFWVFVTNMQLTYINIHAPCGQEAKRTNLTSLMGGAPASESQMASGSTGGQASTSAGGGLQGLISQVLDCSSDHTCTRPCGLRHCLALNPAVRFPCVDGIASIVRSSYRKLVGTATSTRWLIMVA